MSRKPKKVEAPKDRSRLIVALVLAPFLAYAVFCSVARLDRESASATAQDVYGFAQAGQ